MEAGTATREDLHAVMGEVSVSERWERTKMSSTLIISLRIACRSEMELSRSSLGSVLSQGIRTQGED